MLKFIGRQLKLLPKEYYATHTRYIFITFVYLYNASSLFLTDGNIYYCGTQRGSKDPLQMKS